MRALAATLLTMSSLAQAATLADFTACAAIADASARLACYDRVAPPTAAAIVPGAATVATPAPAPVVATPTPAPVSALDFGAEQLPVRPADEKPVLRAHLRGTFIEWNRGTTIELDNGQAWKVVTYDHGYYPRTAAGAEVTISEGLLGNYRMTVAGIPRTIAVRRVR